MSDVEAIARVHVMGWKDNYRGLVPDRIMDSRTLDMRERMWSKIIHELNRITHVAVDADGMVRAFSSAVIFEKPHEGFVKPSWYRILRLLILYKSPAGPNQSAQIGTIPLTRSSIIRTSPQGVIAGNANALTVYPPETSLSIGDGFSTEFRRPGVPAGHQAATGCSIRYVKPNQPDNIVRTHDNCSAVIKRTSLQNLFDHNIQI